SVGGSSLADYYLIDCSNYYNPGQVEITIDDVAPVGSSKKSNIRVTLYNENRKKIASKSLSSGTYSLAQLFDGTNPKYGNSFYLVVEASNGKNYMSYNATISTKAFPDATENNSIAAATVIAPPAPAETITGWVGYGDATDCYSLTLTELSGAGQVTLSLGETKAKTKLTVYNAAGKRVKSFSVAAGKAQTYTFFAVEDAVSYIEVTSGDNGKGKQNTYYDLVTSVAYNEKMVFAGSEGSVDGTLAAGETKYYTIDPAAGLADIKLSGMSQSVTMALYDATGKKLKSFSSKKAKTVLGDYLLTEGCYLSVTAKKATDYKVDFSMEYSKPVTVVSGTGSVSGAVSAADQMDIYEFAGGGVCSLSLSGMSQSVTVTLYSSTGKKLKSFSSKKAKTGIAGYMAGDDTYYVTVSGKKDSNYTLTLDMVSEVTVDLTTGTKRVSGKIIDSSTDCYRLLADASGKLTVSLAGDGANVSAALYDSTGKKVKSLSSKDANGKLVLSAYGLKDSEYNLVVTAKGTADYSVLLAPSEDPAANTFAGARVLTEGELVDEWVGTNDALDIFAFTAETAGKLDIDVEFFSDLQSAGTTADVRLFNAGGVELSLDDALSTNVLAGTYFIEVEAINSRKNRDIGYSIAVDLK
ncbi:MAG: hypothetical protein IJC73_06200, partial [Lentisphaeria bacterium]|nr:hypothetical protein [Lentisphaeria bacterium]